MAFLSSLEEGSRLFRILQRLAGIQGVSVLVVTGLQS